MIPKHSVQSWRTSLVGATALALANTLVAASASAQATAPTAFPADSAYAPILCGGLASMDLVKDTNGANGDRDIVGSVEFPALQVANVGDYVFLRLRVDGNPAATGASGSFGSSAWGFVFDTNGDLDNYEYMLLLNGVASGEPVSVFANSSTTDLGSPRESPDTPALRTLTPVTAWATSTTAADSSFSANPDYFVTIAMSITDLTALGFPLGTARVWAGTSSGNGNSLDQDIACHDGAGPAPLFANIPTTPIGIGPFVHVASPASGSFTTDTTPTIAGTATPGAVVTILIDGTITLTATADASGNWTVDASTLPAGAHSVVASASIDVGGTNYDVMDTATFWISSGDADGDGVADTTECATMPCVDTDGDGLADVVDPDDDGDGIPTSVEIADSVAAGGDDPDNDLIPAYLDTDSDGDGVADLIEGHLDLDLDDLPDYLDDNSLVTDLDGDGVPDAIECPDGIATCADTDGDLLPNHLDADDDGDGVPTLLERPAGIDLDTDGDLLPNHLDADDDGDGVQTIDERPLLVSIDTDLDGEPDYVDADDDGDGILTADERMDAAAQTPNVDGDAIDPYLDLDSDGDGINDAVEGRADADGDGMPNYLDMDADGDGVNDATEGTGDADSDGVPDYLDDVDNSAISGGLSGGARCSAAPGTSVDSSALALVSLAAAMLLRRRSRRAANDTKDGGAQ